MELALNLLFAAIALSAFALWKNAPSKHGPAGKQLLVLVFGLALLFPLVSITDDLCATPDLVEGKTFSATKVHLITASEPSPPVKSQVADRIPRLVVSETSVPDLLLPLSNPCSACGLRSPPLA